MLAKPVTEEIKLRTFSPHPTPQLLPQSQPQLQPATQTVTASFQKAQEVCHLAQLAELPPYIQPM